MAIQGSPGIVTPASLTELGFVAVIIDARGTTYRSREFSHYSWLNLNTIGLEAQTFSDPAAVREWLGVSQV